jgi:dihydrolipoamide dehydrogenase
MDYQVIVIGAGPGGYVAAIRAAQLGLRVALIEKCRVGGVCLNQGCIPTKTLAASAELYQQIRRAREYGIAITGAAVDWGQIMVRKAAVVDRLVKGVEFLLKKNQVTVITGTAAFEAPHTLRVTTRTGEFQTITGEKIIIATGSTPVTFPSLGYNGKTVVTSEEALDRQAFPARIVIIGGGVIGCEFASIYRALGAEVTIIELLPQLLPQLEAELGKQLALSLKKKGVQVHTGTKVTEVISEGEASRVFLADGTEIQTDLVLLSLGRRPNLVGLGLEKLGVALSGQGRIMVDGHLGTNLPWLYAVGDLNDVPYDLAHVASAQGIVAAENIAGLERELDYQAVPNCIFTSPEIASVGLSVAEAKENGYQVKLGRFPMMANGKALAMGESEGFALIVAEEATDRVLGVHLMGPRVTDLIAEAALAVRLGLTAQDLARTIHAHPTLTETVMEAAEAILGSAIHI